MDTHSQNSDNVLDIRTGQNILPQKVRSILKGQYVESEDQKHSPEQFVHFLEQRLVGDLARTAIEMTRNIFEGDKNK